MLELIQQLGHDLHLLIIGIVLIIIGAVGPEFLPIGGRGWYTLLVIGIVVVIVWLVKLLIGLA